MSQTAAAHTIPEKLIEDQLSNHVAAIESVLDVDIITFIGPIYYGADDLIRDEIEAITPPRKPRLAVILETSGGYIEVAQRIVDTLRHHYNTVDFIVPNFAMSAGTVLVMSGDAIYMDYYSQLGPIDPQVSRSGRGMIPALGYLEQYKRLIKKAQKGTLTTAEISYLIHHFDPAELYNYEQARELSISLLKEWLVRYKFKNWVKTATRGIAVTPAMREKQADKIAKMLNNIGHWHSHGRGISLAVVRRDLGLQVEDFGEVPELGGKIRAYYKLLQGYMMRRAHENVIHRRGRYQSVGGPYADSTD